VLYSTEETSCSVNYSVDLPILVKNSGVDVTNLSTRGCMFEETISFASIDAHIDPELVRIACGDSCTIRCHRMDYPASNSRYSKSSKSNDNENSLPHTAKPYEGLVV
jgi:hypothetical protein